MSPYSGLVNSTLIGPLFNKPENCKFTEIVYVFPKSDHIRQPSGIQKDRTGKTFRELHCLPLILLTKQFKIRVEEGVFFGCTHTLKFAHKHG
jgi:hypothetical protein